MQNERQRERSRTKRRKKTTIINWRKHHTHTHNLARTKLFEAPSEHYFFFLIAVDLKTSQIQLNHLLFHCTAWIFGRSTTLYVKRITHLTMKTTFVYLFVLSTTICPCDLNDLHLCNKLKCDRLIDEFNRKQMFTLNIFSRCDTMQCFSKINFWCTHVEMFMPLLSYLFPLCLIWHRTNANLAD